MSEPATLKEAVLKNADELPHWYANNFDRTQHGPGCVGCLLLSLALGVELPPVQVGWACAFHEDQSKPHTQLCTSWRYRKAVER